jgi:hypothetical protein
MNDYVDFTGKLFEIKNSLLWQKIYKEMLKSRK